MKMPNHCRAAQVEFPAPIDSSSLLQVQGARGRLLAAAADSLRERGADGAANEGKAKQADGR